MHSTMLKKIIYWMENEPVMSSPEYKRIITAYIEDNCIKVVEDCGPTVMDARAIVLTFKEASDLCRVIQERLDEEC